jgi:hypothetical protein
MNQIFQERGPLPEGEIFEVFRLSDVPDFDSYRPSGAPCDPRIPYGEWYCRNEDCNVREVRVALKFTSGSAPALPSLCCPVCAEALAFHHYLVAVRLRAVGSTPDGEPIEDGVDRQVKVRAEQEKAYRRGYMQGWSVLRQLMERGLTVASASRFERTIYAWRCKASAWLSGQQVTPVRPPEPTNPLR